MSRTHFNHVVFDVDGTLVDTIRQSYRVDCGIFVELGGSIPDFAAYRRLYRHVGNDWDAFYRARGVADTAQALEFYMQRIEHEPVSPIPGAREMVELAVGLHNRREGATVPGASILSRNNSRGSVFRRLKEAGLDSFFARRDMHAVPDMKTGGLIVLCDLLEQAAENVLYVGDTSRDAIEARAAGVKSAIIAHDGYSYNERDMIVAAKPDYLLSDIRELEPLLRMSA